MRCKSWAQQIRGRVSRSRGHPGPLPGGPARTQVLVTRLGAADKIRLQRHLDELRELERRVGTIAPPQTSACMRPNDPGADPAVGNPQGNDGTNNTYAQNLGYSNEEGRANLFVDLIHLAMVCDLTRVASLQMTMFQSHLNMNELTGQATDLHELGHGGVQGGTVGFSQGSTSWPRGNIRRRCWSPR